VDPGSTELRVVLTDPATADLDEIWFENAERLGIEQADEYRRFLLAETEKLLDYHRFGTRVPTRREFQYMTFKVRSSAFGHVCIYRVTASTIEVLRYFHTSQDWQRYAGQIRAN